MEGSLTDEEATELRSIAENIGRTNLLQWYQADIHRMAELVLKLVGVPVEVVEEVECGTTTDVTAAETSSSTSESLTMP